MSIEAAKQVVRRLIRELKKENWELISISDSEAEDTVSNEMEAMDLIFDLEMCTVHFRNGERFAGVLLIPCNGAEVISDFSVQYPDFEAAVDEVCDYAEQFLR